MVLAMILLAFGSPASGQDGMATGDQTAIQGVITRQLQAFSRDDADGAFGFASRSIQDQFGDPPRFLEMVRRAYPTVHRSRSAEFTELKLTEGGVVQQVELVGPNGEAELALYSMERDSAGLWKISGCVLVRSARVAA